MENSDIEAYLGIIKAEMLAEHLETIDREFIKEIVLRAGGRVEDVESIVKHSSLKEIDKDLFYIK